MNLRLALTLIESLHKKKYFYSLIIVITPRKKKKVRVNEKDESSPVLHCYGMLNMEEINCLLFMKQFF